MTAGTGAADEVEAAVSAAIQAGCTLEKRLLGCLGRYFEAPCYFGGQVVYHMVRDGLTDAHLRGFRELEDLEVELTDDWARVLYVQEPTPLHVALCCGHVGAVEALLLAGADCVALTGEGSTALQLAEFREECQPSMGGRMFDLVVRQLRRIQDEVRLAFGSLSHEYCHCELCVVVDEVIWMLTGEQPGSGL